MFMDLHQFCQKSIRLAPLRIELMELNDYCLFILGMSILTFFLKLPWYIKMKEKADKEKEWNKDREFV